MLFAPLLFSLCNAGKCEGCFQLRPQKLDSVLGWLPPEAAPIQMRASRNWEVIVDMTSVREFQIGSAF
jgi:hypothetical protein